MNSPMPKKSRLYRIGAKLLLGFFAALLSQCMDDKVAGTTSSTENPSVIVMSFKTANSNRILSGRMQIFSKRHNPVFDSLPLADFALDSQDSISFLKKTIDSIVRMGKPDPDAIPDSLYGLNVLVKSDSSGGGIIQGLVYDYKMGRFLDNGSPIKNYELEISSLMNYDGGLKIGREDTALVNYLYIAGTPYFSILNNETSRFSFKQIPNGSYKVLYLPTGYRVTGPITYNIIALDDSLHTDSSRIFTPVSVEDTLQGLPKPPRTQD